MVEPGELKYKGTRGPSVRQGMGRLRRAMGKEDARQGGWERLHDDDDTMDRLSHSGKAVHGGESLLMKFNRLAQDSRADGVPGTICGFQGQAVLVRRADADDKTDVTSCAVRNVLKKKIAGVKNPLCVGDRVRVAPPDAEGAEWTIVAIAPRTNQLERADSHNKALIHVFAANIDCLVVVASIKDPDLKLGLIDRYQVIAATNGIPVTVVLNKADLGDPTMALELYRSLGFPVFSVSARNRCGDLDALRAHLAGKTCVVAGQSGVGKSSLVNALYPELDARVGLVADAGHGRHTTNSARSYALPDGGSLVDTPGIRECAVTGLRPVDVALLMPDLAAMHAACKFADCSHTHEPECAVLAAVEQGLIAPSRYENYRSIISEDLA